MGNNSLIIEPKPPKGEDGYHCFSIRIKQNTFDKIEKISSESGRSRNEVIRMLLTYALENCKVNIK